ncbi:A-kinase anchor protein 10, mitochondrial [Anopheles nili]|uniref:A-kinase anchor protein 10, mitochondrial n=1 Tax=Anopheles nili TaxID=185578 RepID=UPI00237A8512|nr:A-kinase anchor protein 10, mitochondrial [Anopheles nili]
MLQFLKKTGRRKSITGSVDNCEPTLANRTDDHAAQFSTSHDVIDSMKLPQNDEEALQLAEQYCIEKKEYAVGVSKLSRRMVDILADQKCMCYFVQFLESNNALTFIKFWLEVESFKAAASESGLRDCAISNRYPGERLHRSVSSDVDENLSFCNADCDSLSTNSFSESTDDVRCTSLISPTSLVGVLEEHADNKEKDHQGNCVVSLQEQSSEGRRCGSDLKHVPEICDITIMRQSLTDDEKTQICEASNAGLPMQGSRTPISSAPNKCPFNSLISSDAVRIYKKYLITNSSHHIDMPATILSNISLALCNLGRGCNEVIFNEAQHYLLELLEQNYLYPFMESSFYCKYSLEVLTSEDLVLRDVLSSELALFYFMEHLEQQHKHHYLEFYVGAVNFKRSFENKAQAQKDAMVLYEKYFSLQATSSLKLSDKLRALLEEHICSSDPGCSIAECFELPVRIIEHFLEQQYFAGFIRSPLYSRFITELLGKVGKTPHSISILPSVVDRQEQRRRYDIAGTDGRPLNRKISSDGFISSQNTLLAMPDSSFYRRNRKQVVNVTLPAGSGMPVAPGVGSVEHSLHIDSRQLYNPDLLWRRRSSAVAAGLTFGRIDALGRYERDFDIVEPPSNDDRWNRSLLKKAVRRLVNLPEDKVQEELAWQVAEMIIKEITNVTMNHNT